MAKRIFILVLMFALIINTVPNVNAVSTYRNKELAQAVELGFGAYRSNNPTVTYKQFMKMLDRAVELADASKLAKWKTCLPLARKSNKTITRFNAMLAVLYTANTLGSNYTEFNTEWGSLNTKIGEPWSSCIADTKIFGNWPFTKVSKGFVNDKYVYDWDNYAVAYFYGMARSSHNTGNRLFDYDSAKNSMRPSVPLTYTEALLVSSRLYWSYIQPERALTESDKKILAEAERRREAIQNSHTNVTVTGKKYYVSNSGNDNNDGLSPQTSWNTITKVNNVKLNPGDGVFFKRGDLWRSQLLICQNGITYSAYGEGDKPRIFGSPENGSGAEKWKLLEGTKNIWVFYKDMQDCGGIVLNNSKVAGKYCAYWNGTRYMDLGKSPLLGDNSDETLRKAKPFDVKTIDNLRFFNKISYADENYYSRSGELYLRCDAGNPGIVYNSIEFITGFANDESCQALVSLASDSIVDNLCLKFCSSGAYMGDQGHTNEILQNCEIGYIGGTMWMGYTGHNYGGNDFGCLINRSGDGVLMGGSNNKCINNYIYQVWDNAVTVEASGEKDQLIENNYIEYCHGGLMTGGWNMVDVNEPQYENITFANNYVMWMGRFNNWSHFYDGLDNGGAQILISNNPGNRNIKYINNVFYESLDNPIVTYYNYDPKQPITFSGNTYIQLNGGLLIDYEHYTKNKSGKYVLHKGDIYYYNDDALQTINSVLGDRTATVLPMSFIGRGKKEQANHK